MQSQKDAIDNLKIHLCKLGVEPVQGLFALQRLSVPVPIPV